MEDLFMTLIKESKEFFEKIPQIKLRQFQYTKFKNCKSIKEK